MSTSTAEAINDQNTLSVEVDIADHRWEALPRLQEAFETALALTADLGNLLIMTPAEVAIRLTSDADIRDLNKTHRGLDKATDVLSFPQYPDDFQGARGPLLGDLVLGYETCMADAEALGISPLNHVLHLTIHGFLHLFGHDHEEEDQARLMERLEVDSLARLGIANPYIVAK